MGRTQVRLMLESWWRRWCAVELRTRDRNANVTTTGTAETESGIHVLGMGKWCATNVLMRRKRRLSIQRVIRVDAPKKELCERELGGCICQSGTVWGSLSRYILKQSGAGLGTRRALERMHRSKNSAKESCVAASAHVTSLGLPVLLVSVLHEGLHEGGVELYAGRGVW